jgi:hypothetical protein
VRGARDPGVSFTAESAENAEGDDQIFNNIFLNGLGLGAGWTRAVRYGIGVLARAVCDGMRWAEFCGSGNAIGRERRDCVVRAAGGKAWATRASRSGSRMA